MEERNDSVSSVQRAQTRNMENMESQCIFYPSMSFSLVLVVISVTIVALCFTSLFFFFSFFSFF